MKSQFASFLRLVFEAYHRLGTLGRHVEDVVAANAM
jgi:hypothetical protein